jgi:hypothetical protein
MTVQEEMSIQEMARELTVIRIERARCCEPYDCMHHEMCGDESYGYCGDCQRRALLRNEFDAACEAACLDGSALLRGEERRIEQERMDFYSRMNEEGNDDAAFWTDTE